MSVKKHHDKVAAVAFLVVEPVVNWKFLVGDEGGQV
jgi:hypothetical protein